MATPKPLKKYGCSQSELYAICKIGSKSFEDNLADFTAVKTIYDAAYVTAFNAEIAVAKAMPGELARNAIFKSLSIQLQQLADVAILLWKSLRSLIHSSFPVEQVEPKEEAAGYGYYATALDYDWEDLSSMLTDGKTFITNNTAVLTTGGMPATFAAAYNTAMNAFDNKYDDFINAEQDAEEFTAQKIIANNALYDKLMAIFDDGQIIYDNNAAKRDRFIFNKVKALVTTPGSGAPGGELTTITIEGKVTNSATSADIPGATVSLAVPGLPDPIELVTNGTGDYTHTFDEVPVDEETDVTVSVSAPGFTPAEETIHIVAGNNYTRDYSLTATP